MNETLIMVTVLAGATSGVIQVFKIVTQINKWY